LMKHILRVMKRDLANSRKLIVDVYWIHCTYFVVVATFVIDICEGASIHLLHV